MNIKERCNHYSHENEEFLGGKCRLCLKTMADLEQEVRGAYLMQDRLIERNRVIREERDKYLKLWAAVLEENHDKKTTNV